MIKPPFVSRVPILHGWAGPTSPKKCPGEQCFFNTVLGHLTMSTREQESLSKYAAPEKKAPQVVWNWFGGMFGLLKVSDSEGQPPTHAFASIAWPLWIASSGARSRRGARGLGIHRRRHPRGVYIYMLQEYKKQHHKQHDFRTMEAQKLGRTRGKGLSREGIDASSTGLAKTGKCVHQ